jgi:hypothetical protein
MPPPELDVLYCQQASRQPPGNEHVHKRLRVKISKTLEPLTSPLKSTKRTHYPPSPKKIWLAALMS